MNSSLGLANLNHPTIDFSGFGVGEVEVMVKVGLNFYDASSSDSQYVG